MWMRSPFALRIRKSRRSKEKMFTNPNWSRPRDERKKMKIGFIGLGIMGSRMAANLQKQGHSLVVFNRTREKAEPLITEGAKWADSPAALALLVEVIFTMLAHPDAVEQAALGPSGLLRHFGPGKMWIDCSTVNPSFSRKMAVEANIKGIGF